VRRSESVSASDGQVCRCCPTYRWRPALLREPERGRPRRQRHPRFPERCVIFLPCETHYQNRKRVARIIFLFGLTSADYRKYSRGKERGATMQNSQINYWFVGALVAMSLSASIVLL